MITQQGNKIYGYASVFNVVDQDNDIILQEAFAKSIEEFDAGRKVPFLWQHKIDQPIGVIDKLEADNYGLYMSASVLGSVQQASEAFELIKSGAINGLSIGYHPLEYHYAENAKYRYISAINLLEISLVTFPANGEAIVTRFKNLAMSSYSQFQNICDRAIKTLCSVTSPSPESSPFFCHF